MKIKQLFVAITATTIFSPFAHGLTLQEAFQQASKTNPTILAAHHREAAQSHRVGQEKAAWLPTLDLYSSWGRERSRNNTVKANNNGDEDAFDTLSRSENKIVLKQLLFDGYETTHQIAAAKARGEAESHNTQSVQGAIFLNVAEVYFDVLRFQALHQQAVDYVSAQKSIAAKVKDRASTGYGDKTDQLQASSRLRLARAELRQIQKDLETAKVSFEQVVGVEPNGLALPGTGQTMPETLALALEQAQEGHPDLQMAMARKVAAERNYDASQGAMWPEFGVELSASKNRNLDGSEGPNDDFSAMLTMNFNLFRGGADTARKVERAEQMNQSMQEYQEALRKTRENVARAWHGLMAAQDRVKEISQYAKERNEVKKSFFDQYELGRRSLLNLLDSEQESFNARRMQVNEEFTLQLEQYRLLNAVGMLADSHSQ